MKKLKYFLAFVFTLFFICKNTPANATMQPFSLSPDGKRIAYCVPAFDANADGCEEIWTCNINGENKQKIASFPNEKWNIGWIDNNTLVRWTDMGWHGDITYQIPVISIDSGKIRNIEIPKIYRSFGNELSPDGKKLVFMAVREEPVPNSKVEWVVALVDLTTGKLKEIFEEMILKDMPAWSPDSKRISFGDGDYGSVYRLFVLDTDTGKIIDTGQKGICTNWSRDGYRMLFTGNIPKGSVWNGSIMEVDFKTGMTKILTEPPITERDEKMNSTKIEGCCYPRYSPDGRIIYYSQQFSWHEMQSKVKGELWIMNTDGTNKKKLLEDFTGFIPFSWSPDGNKVFFQKENEILAIDINTLQKKEVIKWEEPKAPKITEEGWQTLKGDLVEVHFWGIKPEYAKALQSILSEAKKSYKNIFSFSLPDKLYLEIVKHPDKRTRLWTDGNDHIFLDLHSTKDLAPSSQSGVFNIYGMCHELGHIAMYRKMRDLVGLPNGIGEGWAHYAGSVVVDEIYKTLGEKIYPQPYNFAQFEGTARLQKQTADKEMLTNYPDTRAASMFYNLHLKYGPEKVGKALSLALEENSEGVKLMPLFREKLVQVTGDKEADTLIPEEFLVSKTLWEVKEKEITKQTFEGLQTITNNDTALLKYDDGIMDGERSMSGSGHAVLFQKPGGDWSVIQLQIYASRYGSPEPPKENFRIYLCDKDFEVIKKIEKPYGIFEQGDKKWYKIDIDPVTVPDIFYVCVDFNPTATKGVLIGFDKDVVRSHSRNALPYTYISDVKEKFDWMIRVVLKKPAG